MVLALWFLIPKLRSIPPEIIQDPNEILHSVSEPVDEIDNEVRKIVEELKETISKVDGFWGFVGLGMAAPQIGYNKRIIVLRESKNNYQEMINPQVLEQKWRLLGPQMCFSTKGWHILNRYYWYKIQYLDIESKKHIEIIKGGRAATLNQELDHLNGILITD